MFNNKLFLFELCSIEKNNIITKYILFYFILKYGMCLFFFEYLLLY